MTRHNTGFVCWFVLPSGVLQSFIPWPEHLDTETNIMPVLINIYVLKQIKMFFGFNVKYQNQEGTWMEMWNGLPEKSPSYKVLKVIAQLHQYLELFLLKKKEYFLDTTFVGTTVGFSWLYKSICCQRATFILTNFLITVMYFLLSLTI